MLRTPARQPSLSAALRAKAGGAKEARTPDLLNAIQALYQLSYDPIRSEKKSKTSPRIVKTILRFELVAPNSSLRV